MHYAGHFLGGLMIAVSVQWWAVDAVNWIFVAAAALVCGILSLFWGEPFLVWLKDHWWWTD